MSAPMASIGGEVYYAIACNTAGKELWKTQFYAREYIQHLETDVQNFFIVNLYVTGQHVCIKPEYGNIINMDKQTGEFVETISF
jgi:hypothetical protein